MPKASDLTDFDEVLEVVRGLRGKLVEASVFVPEDDGKCPVVHVGGILQSVEMTREDRWLLLWTPERGNPSEVFVALSSNRFQKAELTFTGEEGDSFTDDVKVTGHNAFLKIWLDSAIVDLIVYI